MIFAHTHELVMSGVKSQTRRVVKSGQYWNAVTGTVYQHYDYRNDVPVYSEEHTYAVQPGRGQKAVGRIEITAIRREDVRQISHEDVIAEGFRDTTEFWYTWIGMHDKSWLETFEYASDKDYLYEYGFWHKRPEHRYQAWVLEFRLVEPAP